MEKLKKEMIKDRPKPNEIGSDKSKPENEITKKG
jgi:hypothetical protein